MTESEKCFLLVEQTKRASGAQNQTATTKPTATPTPAPTTYGNNAQADTQNQSVGHYGPQQQWQQWGQ